MVLPAHLSEGVQSAINGGRFGGGAGSHPNAGAGSDKPPGDVHVNYSVSAMDPKGVASMLREHGGIIADIVKQQYTKYGQSVRRNR
jgi:hypothetical protein